MNIASNKSILIVDDIPANLKVLLELLQQSGFRVSVAKNGESALVKAEASQPALILLDVMMPGLDGFETCRRLKANPNTQEIPIIFLSALNESINKVEGFAVGGVDYISKPFYAEEVLARVNTQINLQEAKIALRQLNAELENRVRERTAQLEQEIEIRKQAEEKLRRDALHDALTNLPNRTLLMERVEMALKRAKRQEDYLFAVIFIDLDRFKLINDTLGHQVGDHLLIEVVNRLQSSVRVSDTLARLGGDEFIILLDPLEHITNATEIADRIAEKLRSPFYLEGQEYFITASLGIVFNSSEYQYGAEMLRDADIAMYRAKDKGKARYEIFHQGMQSQTWEQLQLSNDLHQVIEKEELQVHYQPIISLITGKLTGFEALLRWQHPVRGLLFPAQFIPIAEETGLIVAMGEWVLSEACQQISLWQTQFPMANPLKVSVNISIKQIQDPDFIDKIDQILADTGIKSQYLILELTESVLMQNVESLIVVLSQLRSRGIELSIDDFGTGYSSLSYLHRLPINNLKVDRSFISCIENNGENQTIIETILTLARHLDMEVVAEGVETLEQRRHLKALNCEEAQGYLFSKPLEGKAAEALIRANAQW